MPAPIHQKTYYPQVKKWALSPISNFNFKRGVYPFIIPFSINFFILSKFISTPNTPVLFTLTDVSQSHPLWPFTRSQGIILALIVIPTQEGIQKDHPRKKRALSPFSFPHKMGKMVAAPNFRGVASLFCA